jgi:hypothetical protein
MRPLASAETELLTSGLGSLLIGLAGLAAAIGRGTPPGRALVTFSVVAALLAVVQRRTGARWLTRAAELAPAMPDGARLEPERRTVARTGVSLAVMLGLVLAAAVLGAGLAAPIGGVVFGVGAADLRTARWMRRRRQDGQQVLREVGGWVAGGRRPVYTRPLRASTLET